MLMANLVSIITCVLNLFKGEYEGRNTDKTNKNNKKR